MQRLTLMPLRKEFIEKFGGRCECCGESHPGFLTLEHLRKDGRTERKNGRSTIAILQELKREGWPRDGRYSLLCHNCNWASYHYPQCPHKNPDVIQWSEKNVDWRRLRHSDMGKMILRLLRENKEPMAIRDLYEKMANEYYCSNFKGKFQTAISRYNKKGYILKVSYGTYQWIKDF